jgi:membrane protease YdiL (CAAX protease family)
VDAVTDAETRRRRRRPRTHYRDPLGALTAAGIGYLVALLLALLVVPRIGALEQPAWLTQLLAYLLIWVPLLGAVLLGGIRYGSGSLRDDAGLRIRWIDLGIGGLVGLVLRFIVQGIAPATPQASLDGTATPPTAQLAVLVIGAVVIAPLIEELFFRGILQRSVSGLVRGGRAARIVVAVLASTALFVLLHLASAAPATWGAVAVTTGLSGLVLGLLAATTRRLGSAIVAHVVFNALGLVFLYVR